MTSKILELTHSNREIDREIEKGRNKSPLKQSVGILKINAQEFLSKEFLIVFVC